jgi:hypothetical protein
LKFVSWSSRYEFFLAYAGITCRKEQDRPFSGRFLMPYSPVYARDVSRVLQPVLMPVPHAGGTGPYLRENPVFSNVWSGP